MALDEKLVVPLVQGAGSSDASIAVGPVTIKLRNLTDPESLKKMVDDIKNNYHWLEENVAQLKPLYDKILHCLNVRSTLESAAKDRFMSADSRCGYHNGGPVCCSCARSVLS